MQEKLRLVDQNQAVAANGAEDVDDHGGEHTLSGTEQQRLVVPEERDTVFEQDHLAQSLGVQVVDLTRRNGDVELVLVAFPGFDCCDRYVIRLTIERSRAAIGRSEERRVGKEGVSTCSSRWSPSP